MLVTWLGLRAYTFCVLILSPTSWLFGFFFLFFLFFFFISFSFFLSLSLSLSLSQYAQIAVYFSYQSHSFILEVKKLLGRTVAGVKRNIRGRRGVGFGLEGRKVVIFLAACLSQSFDFIISFFPFDSY